MGNLGNVLTSVRGNALRVSPRTRSVRAFVRNRLAGEVNSGKGELRASEDHGSRITISVGLCLGGRIIGMGGLIMNLVGIVTSGTRGCDRAIVPNCARLRETRPVAFKRRLLTCNRVLLESISELRSYLGEVSRVPLNSYTLTNAACPVSEAVATRLLNFSEVAGGSLSNISSESCYVRFTSILSVVVIRLSEFSRRVVV